MKISYALLAAAVVADNRDEDGNCLDDYWNVDGECVATLSQRPSSRTAAITDEKSGERRYKDLKEMAKKFFHKKGLKGKNKFDEKKYWAYGCHCLMLGDRPMSEMGKGSPVDSLDNKCKAYKDCQKCVREKHGDQCIGEFVDYYQKWSKKSNGFVTSAAAGTCPRALYECDLQFVKDTYAERDAFNTDYHMFWTTTGFDKDDDSSCPTGGSNPVDHACCGGHDRRWQWIGLNKNKCCVDGKSGIVKPIGEQC